MNRTRIAIITSGVVVILTVLFSFLIQGKGYEALVMPIVRDFYVLRFYISCLPQILVWGVVIGGLGLIMLITYRRTVRSLGHRPRVTTTHAHAPHTNPLYELAIAIRHARHFPVYRYTVAHELAELAVRIIARRNGASIPEARGLFKSGTWCDDEEIRDFLAYTRIIHGLRLSPDFARKLEDAVSYLEHFEQGV